VQAVDQAGNLGTTESQAPVRIDLSQPDVANIRVTALTGEPKMEDAKAADAKAGDAK
jgi:hypothetical protein